MPPTSPNEPLIVELSPPDRAAPWYEDLTLIANAALRSARDRVGLDPDRSPRVETLAPEKAFYDRLGQRPHRLAAVAIADQNLVLVNREKFMAASRRERHDVLVHEFTHLILGRRIPGGIPRWLDEGLAMVAARDRSIRYHTRLQWAATFGGLVPLGRLWQGPDGVDETLAYAQSLSATRFLLRTHFNQGSGDDPQPLIRYLADPAKGVRLRAFLKNPRFVHALDRRWRASIKTFWTWIGALTGGGALWIAMTWLFLFTYWRKRRRALAIQERWREEEEAFPYLD